MVQELKRKLLDHGLRISPRSVKGMVISWQHSKERSGRSLKWSGCGELGSQKHNHVGLLNREVTDIVDRLWCW